MTNESGKEYAGELKHMCDKAHADRPEGTGRLNLLRMLLDWLYDGKSSFLVNYLNEPKDKDEQCSMLLTSRRDTIDFCFRKVTVKTEKRYMLDLLVGWVCGNDKQTAQAMNERVTLYKKNFFMLACY